MSHVKIKRGGSPGEKNGGVGLVNLKNNAPELYRKAK